MFEDPALISDIQPLKPKWALCVNEPVSSSRGYTKMHCTIVSKAFIPGDSHKCAAPVNCSALPCHLDVYLDLCQSTVLKGCKSTEEELCIMSDASKKVLQANSLETQKSSSTTRQRSAKSNITLSSGYDLPSPPLSPVSRSNDDVTQLPIRRTGPKGSADVEKLWVPAAWKGLATQGTDKVGVATASEKRTLVRSKKATSCGKLEFAPRAPSNAHNAAQRGIIANSTSSAPKGKPRSIGSRRGCISCHITATPCWRPSWDIDRGQLCNSCGLRWRKTRIRCSSYECVHIPSKIELAALRMRYANGRLRCERCSSLLTEDPLKQD